MTADHHPPLNPVTSCTKATDLSNKHVGEGYPPPFRVGPQHPFCLLRGLLTCLLVLLCIFATRYHAAFGFLVGSVALIALFLIWWDLIIPQLQHWIDPQKYVWLISLSKVVIGLLSQRLSSLQDDFPLRIRCLFVIVLEITISEMMVWQTQAPFSLPSLYTQGLILLIALPGGWLLWMDIIQDRFIGYPRTSDLWKRSLARQQIAAVCLIVILGGAEVGVLITRTAPLWMWILLGIVCLVIIALIMLEQNVHLRANFIPHEHT